MEASKERIAGNYYGAGEMEYEAEKSFFENMKYLAPSADSGELWGEVLKLYAELWEVAELEEE